MQENKNVALSFIFLFLQNSDSILKFQTLLKNVAAMV